MHNQTHSLLALGCSKGSSPLFSSSSGFVLAFLFHLWQPYRMILTIGYQRESLQTLRELAENTGGVIVDVRTSPVSRKPGFGRRQLEAALGALYTWRGDVLGGRGHVTPEGIQWLRDFAASRTAILLCQCHAPGDCHRHSDICAPHFPDAVHLFETEAFEAGELTAAIATGAEYDCWDRDEFILDLSTPDAAE